jgi:seryl-tRNA synthetase
MAEENGTGTEGEELEVDGQDDQDGQNQNQNGDGDATDADERYRKTLEESKKYRKRAQQAEAELEKLKREGESDTDKLRREHEQAQQRVTALQETVRNLSAEKAAAKLGLRAEAVEDVARLLDWDSIEDADDPKQVEKAVREFVKARPYLKANGVDYDAGEGRGSRGEEKATLGGFVRREAGVSS